MTVATTKADVLSSLDEIISQYFESSIGEAAKIHPSYKQLWETLYALIRSGGKRMRPQITMLAYEAFGGKDHEKIRPIAAAQELLHFSLLIHDDVIDRDYKRYGTLNIAGTYKSIYSEFLESESDQTHFAHSAAVLAGDLMLSGAHQLIAASDLSAEQKNIAQQLLSLSVFEVAGGELLDTEISFGPYSDGDALKIARYKTAGYSFMTPLLTGAKLAGISDEKSDILRDFALSLGVAYQLVDDLLGTFGDEESTGKSTTSDIVEGKRTYMIEQAITTMSDSDRKVFDASFGNRTASADQIDHIKNLLVTTGAKTATEQAISEYADKAGEALGKLQLADTHHALFAELIHRVVERTR